MLTYLLLFTLLTSGLTHFFQMTMQKGMVFRWYKYFIKYYLDYKPRRKRISWKYSEGRNKWYVMHLDKPKWYSWFYKPLGGCYKCNGFWIFALMWLLINLSISELSITETLILIPLGAGMNYVFSQIMIQYFIL